MGGAKVTLSSYFIVTEPEKMGYPYLESISSALGFSDEVVIVAGRPETDSERKIKNISDSIVFHNTDSWPVEWEKKDMEKHLQIALDLCSGDFALKIDSDHIFRESSYHGLIRIFKEQSEAHLIRIPRINFYSWVHAGRSCLKHIEYSKTCFAINKKLSKDSGIDFEIRIQDGSCLPYFNSENIVIYESKDRGLFPINYDNTFMSKKQISKKWAAWQSMSGVEYRNEAESYLSWESRTKQKSSGWANCEVGFHPQIVIDKYIDRL